MKDQYVRNKRQSADHFEPLVIDLEKKAAKQRNGLLQSVIFLVVSAVVMLVLFSGNLRSITMMLAFMVVNVIVNLIMKFWDCIYRTRRFPFFAIERKEGAYHRYLRKTMQKINEYTRQYEKYLAQNLFPPEELKKIVYERKPQLFCRLPKHQDFLTVNLGLSGVRPLIKVNYPKLSYQENQIELEKFRDKLDKKYTEKRGESPVGVSLIEYRSVALVNKEVPEEDFLEIVNAFIMDIAVMQSASEIAMCFMGLYEDLYWTRFLPQIWSSGRRLLYCGDTCDETEKEFRVLLNKAKEDCTRHLIVFADADFLQEYDIYGDLNQENLSKNTSVVWYSREGITPSRVECDICYRKNRREISASYQDRLVKPWKMDEIECEKLTKFLSNIRLVDSHTLKIGRIPDYITFFRLFHIEKAREFPRANRYENINIHKSFPVLVGKGVGGTDVFLDLTNDGDGNHCIVTGTTGSGKSEFIQSYLLAACSLYSPDYLSFVVIDFKGRSLSANVCDLPHCRGEYYNGGLKVGKREVERIITLLNSEIDYRERVMVATDCKGDLNQYHMRYAAGEVSEPLPRVLVIVDEVAEFFSQISDAATAIAHIATVGRSTGIILLLGTQSASAVSRDQIRTNIQTHVAFSNGEEKTAEERVIGRACISSSRKTKIMCQGALSTVHEYGTIPMGLLTCSGIVRDAKNNQIHTQMELMRDEIIRRYPEQRYQEEMGDILTKPLEMVFDRNYGLQELQDQRQVYGGATDEFSVGIADNIFDRQYEPFTYTPGKYSVLICGRPQIGKTSLLKTIMLSMFDWEYGLRPDDIQVYIVAKKQEEYKNFTFPHIGSILPSSQLHYFLLFLRREIERREKMEPQDRVTLVAIIDDCYSEIEDSLYLMECFKSIMLECEKYGITVLMTVPVLPNFPKILKERFSHCISFYLEKETLLMENSRKFDGIKSIPDIPGHCLAEIPNRYSPTEVHVVEVQVATPYKEDKIRQKADEYCMLWRGRPRPVQIPVIPEKVVLPIGDCWERIPVGLAMDLNVCSWNLTLSNTYLISYFTEQVTADFLKYLICQAKELDFDLIIVDNSHGMLEGLKSFAGATFFSCGERDELLEKLEEIKSNKVITRRTMLFVMDFARCLFPNYGEEKELVSCINELLTHKYFKVYGVFAETRDFMMSARTSATRILQMMQGNNSGMLIGNTAGDHEFGKGGLTASAQMRAMDVGWGVNVSPQMNETKLMKIAMEVDYG